MIFVLGFIILNECHINQYSLKSLLIISHAGIKANATCRQKGHEITAVRP